MEALGEWVSVGNRLSCNVDSCLRAFTSPSKLMDENKYRCDVCSNKKRASVKGTSNFLITVFFHQYIIFYLDKSPVLTDAVKQYLIYSAPNVLVLCLKRFYQVVTFNKLVHFVNLLFLFTFVFNRLVIGP